MSIGRITYFSHSTFLGIFFAQLDAKEFLSFIENSLYDFSSEDEDSEILSTKNSNVRFETLFRFGLIFSNNSMFF